MDTLPATETLSLAQQVALLPEAQRLEVLESLGARDHAELLYDWRFWGRPDQQVPEGDWHYWLMLGGRGSGKTRAGAEAVRRWARDFRYVNLIGPTAHDAREIMIEGESGIMAICPKGERPAYQPGLARLTWLSGARSLIFTADEPDRLRGPQHQKLWCEELAAWRYEEAWTQAQFGLRLGKSPQAVITTTPRPTKVIKALVADPSCVVRRVSSYANRAHLSDAYWSIVRDYEGTRLGRQEINAEILDDVPGALWQREWIDGGRLAMKDVGSFARVVVGVDPAVTVSESSDSTGIVVLAKGANGHGYVLADRTGKYSPRGWADVVVSAYEEFSADVVVGEVNNGGDLVQTNLRAVAPHLPFRAVRASRGKAMRAQPIATLYEQGLMHHVGCFAVLEDQLCALTPEGYGGSSPDNADALVWAATELFTARVKRAGVW